MKIFNSLTREVEDFVPIKKGRAGMYTCGMTVYDHAHIGHGRKYVTDDLLRRVLVYNGLEVTHVQNVTDVGHLVSDGDEGEDKLEKGARKSKKTVWEIAEYFTRDFYESMDLLNILRPTVVCKATEHITEQIGSAQKLLDRGFAYDTPEAVYFDVAKFPRYSQLFGRQALDEKLVAVRSEVQTGDHKRNPADFALWFKLTGRFEQHQMHWDSPWGEGFPGWHIECSAMAMKYLGDTFDIHTGGEDHLTVHHPNEIAQAEAATGKPLARYWLHTAFLLVDGAKMSKSLENFYRVQEVMDKGFSPLALRYLYLSSHYRRPMNFTWSALTAAQTAYDKLQNFVLQCSVRSAQGARVELSPEKMRKLDKFKTRFDEAVNNDLNTPQALAVVWEMMKSNIPDYDKADAILDWDAVLGLNLAKPPETLEVPGEVKDLAGKREEARKGGRFVEADEYRMAIEKLGWRVEDTKLGPSLRKAKTVNGEIIN